MSNLFRHNNMLLKTCLLMLVFLAFPLAAHAEGLLDLSVQISGCGLGGGTRSCASGSSATVGSSTNGSGLFTIIACKIMNTIDTAIIPIFCNITQNPSYQYFLDALLTLYVVLIGVGYVGGMTQMKLGNVVIQVAKGAIVYALMANADFFFSFIYYSVVDTPQALIKSLLQVHGSGANDIFEYVDQGMGKIFDEVTQPQMNADDRQTYIAKELTIVGIAVGVKQLVPGGNFIYGLFMFVVMGWLFSYISIVVRYLLAYLAIVFMLMLAPIFIPTILFKKMRENLFDEWLKMLLAFMFELVLVVAFVLMIEQFYTEFYDMLKKSFEQLKLTEGDTRYIRAYNPGTTTDYVKEESVKGYTNVLQDLNKAGYTGDATGVSADLIVNLLTMGFVVFLSSVFLRYIPQFAGMIVGQYNYNKLLGGENFAQKAQKADRTNLFGQTGTYKGGTDVNTADADRPGGGAWDSLTQALNPL